MVIALNRLRLFTQLIAPYHSRLIPLLLSKIELVFSTIMVSNTTYAAPAGRDSEWDLYGRTKAITI